MKLFLASAVTSLFCASAFAQSIQPFDVINPIGDENLGYFLVQSPQDPGGTAKQIAPFSLSGSTNSLVNLKADETHRVPKGNYCVRVGVIGQNMYSRTCDIQVEAKKTTTLSIAALKVDWDKNLLHVDVGPQITMRFNNAKNEFGYNVAPNSTWMQEMPYKYMPIVPGTVSVSAQEASLLGVFNIVLQGGEVHSENLTLPELRAHLQVLPPQRTFQDPTELAMCNHARSLEIVQRNANWNGKARFHHPGVVSTPNGMDGSGNIGYESSLGYDWAKGGTYTFFPALDPKKPLVYELVVNNTWMPVQLKAHDTMTVQLKRIDVNDVFVTREDGTSYYVPGSFMVYMQDAQGAWKLLEVPVPVQNSCGVLTNRVMMSSFKTKTGLDVLPGVYKVVTIYTTQEGAQSDEHILDLR